MANLFVKTILHTPLISCLGTLEPKGHRHIAEGSKGSYEGCLCWKYALKAIIKWLLLYFLLHNNCLLFMVQLY